jgi:hypothetical protein
MNEQNLHDTEVRIEKYGVHHRFMSPGIVIYVLF